MIPRGIFAMLVLLIALPTAPAAGEEQPCGTQPYWCDGYCDHDCYVQFGTEVLYCETYYAGTGSGWVCV